MMMVVVVVFVSIKMIVAKMSYIDREMYGGRSRDWVDSIICWIPAIRSVEIK